MDLPFDFNNKHTDEPIFELPLSILPKLLSHEPLRDWGMKPNGWPHLKWTDALIPSSLTGLEGINFTPLTDADFGDSKAKLVSTRLTFEIINLMVEGRTQFTLEDLCHIPKEKGYWFRIGEPGMTADEYIISDINDHIFIPVCIYDFAFGLHFPLHPFFFSSFFP